MDATKIDINCDLGESYGNFKIGQDIDIFPYITSCNIACGFHGGDPLQIEKTIQLALNHNVRIGAHPSYPDLLGFGRVNMEIDKAALKALVKYQIAALKGLVESQGGNLKYVKPHGALYNTISKDYDKAITVIKAIQSFSSSLALMGLAGSHLEKLAFQNNIPFISEAFIDRRYQENGMLMSRSKNYAVIKNPSEALEQARMIFFEKQVKTETGKYIPLKANSFCIHGDNPSALMILKKLKKSFLNY